MSAFLNVDIVSPFHDNSHVMGQLAGIEGVDLVKVQQKMHDYYLSQQLMESLSSKTIVLSQDPVVHDLPRKPGPFGRNICPSVEEERRKVQEEIGDDVLSGTFLKLKKYM